MTTKRILGARGSDGRWVVSVPLADGSYRIGRGATIHEAMRDAGLEVG